jgi:alpha-D-ribose 1-methylphosphonate 5-triphosphate diphosphatase
MAEPHRDWLFENADVVTPDAVLGGASVAVENGVIAGVGDAAAPKDARRVDATGCLLLPGFIDLHSDLLDKEIEPRPGGRFPFDVAMVELDKQLAACGLTTVFHCVPFCNFTRHAVRTPGHAERLLRDIHRFAPALSVRTRVHARFEVTSYRQEAALASLIDEGRVDLLSVMDHTPGQGQYPNETDLRAYMRKAWQLTDEEIDGVIDESRSAMESFDEGPARRLAESCRGRGIPTASHDDDTLDKVAWVHGLGAVMCEFPVSLHAAQEATDRGLFVLMGSPNVLRGASLVGNLSGRQAVEAGCCDILGSDYAPMTLLHAVFTLHRLGVRPLHELVRMVSGAPATVAELTETTGAIREGLEADLVLVDASGDVPRIVRTLARGREAFAADRR